MPANPSTEDAEVNKKDKTLALVGFHSTWKGREGQEESGKEEWGKVWCITGGYPPLRGG